MSFTVRIMKKGSLDESGEPMGVEVGGWRTAGDEVGKQGYSGRENRRFPWPEVRAFFAADARPTFEICLPLF